MVRDVADILVRTVVTGPLAWLAGWLMVLAAGDDSGGANIGAGLGASVGHAVHENRARST